MRLPRCGLRETWSKEPKKIQIKPPVTSTNHSATSTNYERIEKDMKRPSHLGATVCIRRKKNPITVSTTSWRTPSAASFPLTTPFGKVAAHKKSRVVTKVERKDGEEKEKKTQKEEWRKNRERQQGETERSERRGDAVQIDRRRVQ